MKKRAASLIAPVLLSLAALPTHAEDPPGPRLKTVQQIVTEARRDIDYISAAKLRERIAANDRLVLLDVRTKEEFDAGHLRGAAWVERGIVEFIMVRQLPDPDAEIVVYCKVGHRSGLAARALKDAGYRNVTGLDGGFDEWARQGHSVFNYLGELKVVSITPRDAREPAMDFYQDKKSR